MLCEAAHAPWLPDLDLGIARILQERWQPADFQLRSAFDQHIGCAQLHNKTRTRIDKVGIFRRLRHRRDFDFVAANVARERSRNPGSVVTTLSFASLLRAKAKNHGQDQ